MKDQILHSDPEIMGGELVFAGTRVPVYNLFDYLEAGDSLDEFLEQFPSRRPMRVTSGTTIATAQTNGAREPSASAVRYA